MIVRPDEIDDRMAEFIGIGATTETRHDPTPLARRPQPWATRDYLDEIVRLSVALVTAETEAKLAKSEASRLRNERANDNAEFEDRTADLEATIRTMRADAWTVGLAALAVGWAIGLCWVPVWGWIKPLLGSPS